MICSGVRRSDSEEKLLDRFRDPKDPLKILIVTSKLLTGFDAPILQAMYLDKPLRDHTLLQAICRALGKIIVHRVSQARQFGQILDSPDAQIGSAFTRHDHDVIIGKTEFACHFEPQRGSRR